MRMSAALESGAPEPVVCRPVQRKRHAFPKETPMFRACRTIVVLSATALVIFTGGTAMRAQTTPPKPKPKAATVAKHTILKASQMQWGPAPDSLPAGAQMTVLDGD